MSHLRFLSVLTLAAFVAGAVSIPQGVVAVQQQDVYADKLIHDTMNHSSVSASKIFRGFGVSSLEDPPSYVTEWTFTPSCHCDLVLPAATPTAVAEDGAGNIFVTWLLPPRCSFVERTSRDGQLIDCWNVEYMSTKPFASGIAVDDSAHVYVCSRSGSVFKYEYDGTLLDAWIGVCALAFGIDVDADGNVYVSSPEDETVKKFDGDGNLLDSWGELGAGPGQFASVRGVAVDRARGHVFVTDGDRPASDLYNNRVQQFDTDGNFIAMWGDSGSGPGQFDYPYGIEVDVDGNVFVADQYNRRVQKFDSGGNFRVAWSLADTDSLGFVWDIAADLDGSIFVSDRPADGGPGENRVVKYAAVTPDPDSSTVPCLTLCPFGDFVCSITPRNVAGDSLPNTRIVIDFTACDTVQLCLRDGNEPYDFEPPGFVISGTTDSTGSFTFPIQGGGISYDSLATVWADGVLIAQRPVASCDQDGDLIVGPMDLAIIQSKVALGLPDPTADFNCDSLVTVEDVAIFTVHFSEQHSCVSPLDIEPGAVPSGFALYPSFPNPVRREALIRFDLPEATEVSLKVYDIRGRNVRTAIDTEMRIAGQHYWIWDGRDDAGIRLSPGIYFYVLQTPQFHGAKKAVVLE